MPRLIPSTERIARARKLIQKARELPAPAEAGEFFSYVAEVKDILRQARDLIKFIRHQPSISAETKAEVAALMEEIETSEKEILHRQRG